MKRLFSIFTLLLCFIGGAWAQDFTVATTTTDYNAIQVGKYYAFRECASNVGYLNGASVKTSSVSANQIYKIVDAGEGKVWLQCYGTSEYLGLGNSKSNGNQYETAMVAESANAVAFTLAQRGNAAQVVLDCYPNGGSTKFWLGAQYAGASYAAHYQNDGTGNLSYWSVFEVTFGAPQAKVITNKESAESFRLTIDKFKALKGTDGHFAFHTTQRTDWSQFHKSDTGVYDLTIDQLYTLLNGSSENKVWIANYAGEIITSIGNGAVAVYTADATTGVDFQVVDCGSTLSTTYDADKQFRLDNDEGKHLRIHDKDFTTLTGDWTRYVAYGPFYVVTIQHKCGDDVLETSTAIYSGGELTVEAGTFDGYAAIENSVTTTIDRDMTITLNYEPDTYDVTFHKYEASEEKSYATVYVSFNAELPEGVKAYSAAVSSENSEVLELTAIEGTVLPANTPAILSSTTAVTGENLSAAVTLSKSLETPATVDGNNLEGTVSTTQAPESGYDYYVLGKKNGIGFYKYTASVLPHHRAWIRQAQSVGSNALRFRFTDDVTTYIDAIESSNSKAEIFDLQGRRLRQAQPGMNIINGQKVLVK